MSQSEFLDENEYLDFDWSVFEGMQDTLQYPEPTPADFFSTAPSHYEEHSDTTASPPDMSISPPEATSHNVYPWEPSTSNAASNSASPPMTLLPKLANRSPTSTSIHRDMHTSSPSPSASVSTSTTTNQAQPHPTPKKPASRARRQSQNREAQRVFRLRQRQRFEALERELEALKLRYGDLSERHENLRVLYMDLLRGRGVERERERERAENGDGGNSDETRGGMIGSERNDCFST